MARPFRRGRTGFPVSTRRKTSWQDGGFGRVDGLNADGGAAFTFAVVPGEPSLTLVRLRGELLVSSALSSGDSAEVAVGIGLVTDQALAIGITAFPLPIANINWEGWLYHQWCSVGSVSQSAGNRTQNFRFIVDNKAMRKVEIGNSLIAVVEMDNEQGTGVAVDLQLNTRMLFKLA